ncbi:MAG: DUF2167 domain-containing protein, partial [Muribaculaceae bacterium]|nr:DUF2167 domain-containing protein [Muribaculaceae bacterium]
MKRRLPNFICILTALIYLTVNTFNASAQTNSSTPESIGLTGEVKLNNIPLSFKVPDGLEFISKEDTREILSSVFSFSEENLQYIEGMFIPVAGEKLPQNLLYKGIDLTDPQYFFLLKYLNTGHVNDMGMDKFDFNKLLTKLSQQNPVNFHYSWAWQPSYDEKNHLMTLPITIYDDLDNSSYADIRYILFGNSGIAQIEVEFNDKDNEVAKNVRKYISEISDAIKFNRGDRY